MSEMPVQKSGQRESWALTPTAFRQLLIWLDEGADSDGHGYLEMRRCLVSFFDRKNCSAPDELADETLNRITRRLEEEGMIVGETPARYCYIVARFVFMEYLRETQKAQASFADLQRQGHGNNLSASASHDETERTEKMLACLERCAVKLESPNRKLIVQYYAGQERAKIDNRRALAAELGLTVNALSIRACRIRHKLEDCVSRCLGAG